MESATTKQEILKQLEKLWNKKHYSSMRFGQLLEVFIIGCPRHGTRKCVFYMPDEKLKKLLDQKIKENKTKLK